MVCFPVEMIAPDYTVTATSVSTSYTATGELNASLEPAAIRPSAQGLGPWSAGTAMRAAGSLPIRRLYQLNKNHGNARHHRDKRPP
jgi:hypothetical protein